MSKAKVDRILDRLPKVQCPILVDGEWRDGEIDNVSHFVHLGSDVRGGTRDCSEITHRIALGNVAFQTHSRFLGNRKADLKLKLAAYSMYITSVVSHGFQGWHMGKDALKKLNGFDIRSQARLKGWTHERAAREGENFTL